MARRFFKYDPVLETTVEITPVKCSDVGLTVFVKNETANKKRRGNAHARWPLVSDNAGCQPEQVAEANAACKKMGLATRYNPEGQAIWDSAKDRRAHIKTLNLLDRDGYY